MCHASIPKILAHVETDKGVHSQQNALEDSDGPTLGGPGSTPGIFKQLGRWIRSKECAVQSFQLYDQNGLARNREEATRKIFDHQVRLQESQQVNPEQASQFLAAWFGPCTDFPLQGVRFSTLWKIIRDGDGAAGPDGWSADELRFLPPPAIQV